MEDSNTDASILIKLTELCCAGSTISESECTTATLHSHPKMPSASKHAAECSAVLTHIFDAVHAFCTELLPTELQRHMLLVISLHD